MDSEKIIQDLNRRFAAPLPEFYKRRIVVWIDEDQEFVDKLDEITLGGAKVVALTGTNNFYVKKLLTVDDPTSNYLVYRPFAYESDEDNWLLDIELYGEEFRADLVSMWMDEMGIPQTPALRRGFKQYREFFNAQARRNKVSAQPVTPTTPAQLQMAIMAALAGLKDAKPNAIIKAVLQAGLLKDSNAVYQEFVNYGIDEAFWRMVAQGIPYNGPGRSGAQTLDEANFQRNLAIAFDLVRETLTDAEQTRMREDMFIPGALFLMEHRHNQLHNHEVIINSAIAIIGMLFDREDMVDFALNTPYGLLYQLENGMLENGMWFEGSFGYHFYALTSFLAYEKFALNTRYSHIHHPNYTKMMNFAFDYVQPDGSLPMLGDTNYGHFKSMLPLYEFTYRELREEKMLYMLHLAYRTQKRDNLEAVIYGVDELPPCPAIEPPAQVHPAAGHSGHTMLRGEDGRFLLFKHDRYGGEHDHYDRLGISVYALGAQAAPDMGTTGYGAVMHYDYYKNTGSHNTVVIGEENQSPANAVMTRFEQREGVTFVEAVCDWNAPFAMPDTFTIVQWDEEAYRHVKMTRRIAWTQDYFAERFDVENVEDGRTIDWVLHLPGTRCARAEEQPVQRLSDKKPYKYIHDVTREDGMVDSVQTIGQDEGTTRVFCAAFGGERLLGVGPGNPSYTDLAYIIERARGERATFAHVIETSRGEGTVQNVCFEREGDALRIRVTHRDASIRVIEL